MLHCNAFTIVVSVATMHTAGEHHSLALKRDGIVWAFGFNYHGQLVLAIIAFEGGTVGTQQLRPPTQVQWLKRIAPSEYAWLFCGAGRWWLRLLRLIHKQVPELLLPYPQKVMAERCTRLCIYIYIYIHMACDGRW